MLITTKGRYAVRMLLDIATHQGDGYVSMKCIAGRQGISKNTWNGSPRSLRERACRTSAGASRAIAGSPARPGK